MHKLLRREWLEEFIKNFLFSTALVVGGLWILALFVYEGPMVDLLILLRPSLVLLVVMASIIAWTTTVRYNWRNPEWRVVYKDPIRGIAKLYSVPMEKRTAESYLGMFNDALYVENMITKKRVNKKS